MMPAELLAEMAVGERGAVYLFRRMTDSGLLTPTHRKWAAKISREEIGHARIEEYWLSRVASGYTPEFISEYIQTGRSTLMPSLDMSEPGYTLNALGLLWRAERDAAKFLPRWAEYTQDEHPDFARDMRIIVQEEADHLRFHKSVYDHLQVNHPREWHELQQIRGDLLRRWPKIPHLSDVPVKKD